VSFRKNTKTACLHFFSRGKNDFNEGNVDGLPDKGSIAGGWEIKQLNEVVSYHSNLIDPSDNPEKEYTLIELDDVEKNARGLSNIQSKKENISALIKESSTIAKFYIVSSDHI